MLRGAKRIDAASARVQFSLQRLFLLITFVAVVCALGSASLALIVCFVVLANLMLLACANKLVARTKTSAPRFFPTSRPGAPWQSWRSVEVGLIYLIVFMSWHFIFTAGFPTQMFSPYLSDPEVWPISVCMLEHFLLVSLTLLVLISFFAECCLLHRVSYQRSLQTTMLCLVLCYAHCAVPGFW